MLSLNNPSTVNENTGVNNNPGPDVSPDIDKPNLIAGLYPDFPGIPGVVKAVFNAPGIKVDDIMFHPREFGGAVEHLGTLTSLKSAIAHAAALSKLGATYCLQEIKGFDKNDRAITLRQYDVYLVAAAKDKTELAQIFAESKSNIVDFTRKLSKAGGKIGEVMQEAWKHGVAIATTVALALFEIGKRAMEGGGLVKDEGKNNSSSST